MVLRLTSSMITPQVFLLFFLLCFLGKSFISAFVCVISYVFVSTELFRFSTFARFPTSVVTERSLARAGWFYTGVGDRVQCFRCNVTAEGWLAGDCPTEKHRQLSPTCPFIQSLPSTTNLLSSSHSAFSPLRIAQAMPVSSERRTLCFFKSKFSWFVLKYHHGYCYF